MWCGLLGKYILPSVESGQVPACAVAELTRATGVGNVLVQPVALD